MPRAQGRATPIQKNQSLLLYLGESGKEGQDLKLLSQEKIKKSEARKK